MFSPLKPSKKQQQLLNFLDITEDKINQFCVCDMNVDCEYREHWLIKTDDELILVVLPKNTGVKTFGKYPDDPILELPDAKDLEVKRFSLEQIETFFCEKMITFTFFGFYDKDGVALSVCGATGKFTSDIMQFKDACNGLDFAAKTEENFRPPDGAPKGPHAPGGFGPPGGPPGPPGPHHEPGNELNKSDKKKLFFRMMKYFAPYKFQLLLMSIVAVLIASVAILMPYVSGTIYFDYVLPKNPELLERFPWLGENWVGILVVVMVTYTVLIFLKQLFHSLKALIAARVVPPAIEKIKNDIFESIERLSLDFFLNKQTGGLMTRILDDATTISTFFVSGLTDVLCMVFTFVGAVFMMVSLNMYLAIIPILSVPFMLFVIVKLQPRLHHYYGKRWRGMRNLNGTLNDILMGGRVIKAFGGEQQTEQAFEKQNDNFRNAQISAIKYENKYTILHSGVIEVTALILWTIGAVLMTQNNGVETQLSYGMLAAFITYATLLTGPLQFIVNVSRWWTDASNSADRVFEIIDTPTQIKESPDAIEFKGIQDKLEFKNIYFGYTPEKYALKDVSFTVNKGETLGVVGRSGAGKTTLISLISRLYDPTVGNIIIDGHDIRDYTKNSIRKHVGVVSQESYIFYGTISKNITYAKHDATCAEIFEAAKAANVHDFICHLPDGYDTLVGEGARSLSGGQKQRMSVARAVLAKPDILILDEATAAVDTATEVCMQMALDNLSKNCTTISIAHRLSTLNNADRLIVLEKGKLEESGTRKELLAKNGIYKRLSDIGEEAIMKTTFEEDADFEELNRQKKESMERLKQKAEHQLETNILKPETCRFFDNGGGFLSVETGGEKYNRVNLIRCFPFSHSNQFISVRNVDEDATEIGIIENIDDFDDNTKQLLSRQLSLRYFCPKIEKINNIVLKSGFSYWDAVCDCGKCRFTVGHGGIARIDDKRVIISDIDSNRFEIPDINKLSAKELRMVELYM